MKKKTAVLLAGIMCITLTACGGTSDNAAKAPETVTTEESAATETIDTTETTDTTDTAKDSDESESTPSDTEAKPVSLVTQNPYLPFDEYFADDEPHVFNDRVYIYGSHDVIDYYGGGCAGNYEAYSAPVDNLADWTYEGVLYDKTEDPGYQPGMNMLASDCAEKDGKYYLYYSPVMNTDEDKIAVAVSDSPAGPFHYYGKVAYEDGTNYGPTFDPAILVDDDGRNYLYSGGESSVVELADDMITVIGEPVRLVPRDDEDAASVGCITNPEDLKGYEFYEGSSIRKINGTYYLVWANAQICQYSYATSDAPMGPYTFRGILMSNDGKLSDEEEACYPNGNIHGGILDLGNGKDYWLFYHRQTNGIQNRFFSARQACAERISINEDGSIDRVSMTSQGLNDGPLPAIGNTWSSFIACYLKPEDEAQTSDNAYGPYAKQFATNLHGISNLTDNSVAGFKYFDFGEEEQPLAFSVQFRAARNNGKISLYLDAPNDTDGKKIGELSVEATDAGSAFSTLTCTTEPVSGEHALYFVFDITDQNIRPTDTLGDMADFTFSIPEE